MKQLTDSTTESLFAVDYVVFPDEGHGFRKKENQIQGYGQIKVFLDTYLKGDPGEA